MSNTPSETPAPHGFPYTAGAVPQTGDAAGWTNYIQTQSQPTVTHQQPTQVTQAYAPAPSVAAPPPPVAPPASPHARGTIRGADFDRAPIEVSGLIPIMATPTSRPLRSAAWVLIMTGVIAIALSIVGGVVWSSVVDEVVGNTIGDVRDALDEEDWKANLDLDSTGDSLGTILKWLGYGLALIGAILGLTILAIGGMARQLDRVLAPSREFNGAPMLSQGAAP